MNKFVLCRPQGGLNDILNQIERCYRYAERFDRTLVVETDKYSQSLNRPLDDYFVSRQSRLILDSGPLIETFKTMDVFPGFLAGKLYSYSTFYSRADNRFHEKESKLPITFDFSQNYEERLVVHHQFGGGENSLFCLQRMYLQDSLADAFLDRLRFIAIPYCAVHIRHTDLKTNYQTALNEIGRLQVDKLFVATDNRKVIEDFRSALGEDTIISFAALPSEAGRPVHLGSNSELDADQRNRDAILDVLTLACANILFLCKADNNHYQGYSGYSILAKNLFNEKKTFNSLVNNRLKGCMLGQARSFVFMM